MSDCLALTSCKCLPLSKYIGQQKESGIARTRRRGGARPNVCSRETARLARLFTRPRDWGHRQLLNTFLAVFYSHSMVALPHTRGSETSGAHIPPGGEDTLDEKRT